jgi:hypothetical protein
MIEAILDDEVEVKLAPNSPPFAATLDYAEAIARRNAAVAKWRAMDATARAPHKERLELFCTHEGVPDLKSDVGLQAKNLHLLRNEVSVYRPNAAFSPSVCLTTRL